MDIYLKNFSAFRTKSHHTAISTSLVLDSLSADTSTVTVIGTDIGADDAGSWVVADSHIYLLSGVKPQADRTMLTLSDPITAFNRTLELAEQPAGQTIGGFIASVLLSEFAACQDPAYAIPYLSVINADNTPYVSPDLDKNGCFTLDDYIRTVRRAWHVAVAVSFSGSTLIVTIQKIPETSHHISFDDGRSQLSSVDYSSSGVAKITVLLDVKTGKDDAGNDIVERQRSDWYLAEDGTVSQSVPARRASGSWYKLALSGSANLDVEAKVQETFAKNKYSHKLEFWSSLDLPVQSDCSFFVYGKLLQSQLSYKRKDSTDDRYFYRSGELATTAAEKLKEATRK